MEPLSAPAIVMGTSVQITGLMIVSTFVMLWNKQRLQDRWRTVVLPRMIHWTLIASLVTVAIIVWWWLSITNDHTAAVIMVGAVSLGFGLSQGMSAGISFERFRFF